jgi:hypothetical protein
MTNGATPFASHQRPASPPPAPDPEPGAPESDEVLVNQLLDPALIPVRWLCW